jgi:hypothetical protein
MEMLTFGDFSGEELFDDGRHFERYKEETYALNILDVALSARSS